jgi:hypothetical protein
MIKLFRNTKKYICDPKWLMDNEKLDPDKYILEPETEEQRKKRIAEGRIILGSDLDLRKK